MEGPRQSGIELELYDEMATAVEEGEWTRVGEVGERLLAAGPELGQARAWLAQAQRELATREEEKRGPQRQPAALPRC